MSKVFLKLQFVFSLLLYLFINLKLWSKSYDPRFYDDLFLGRIPFFWFLHWTIGGALLLFIFYRAIKAFNAKYFIFSQILFVITFLIITIFLEVFLRTFPSFLPLQLIEQLGYTAQDKEVSYKLKNTVADKYLDDPELGIIHQPKLSFLLKTVDFSYQFRTDSKGFTNVDDETLYENADIVTIGDSFTEGVGVSHQNAYPNRLAALTNKRVLNLGHGSYDAFQYPIVLKRYGLQAKPKTVIISIWCWNDLQSRYFAWKDQNKDGSMPYSKFESKITTSRAQNRKKSYAYQYAEFLSRTFLKMYMGKWNYGPMRGIVINNQKIDLPLSKYIPGNSLDYNLTVLRSVLSELKSMAAEHHFRLVVIYLPMKEEVYYRFMKNQSETIDYDWLAKPVMETMKTMNVEGIDFTPIFLKEAAQGKKLYHTFDVHLNEEGYGLVAKTLKEYLNK
jgi:lysophospholipase L1-like esterase